MRNIVLSVIAIVLGAAAAVALPGAQASDSDVERALVRLDHELELRVRPPR